MTSRNTVDPLVGVVVLNWNNYKATSRCLRSLLSRGDAAIRIYLVDNASTDGSWEKLSSEFSGSPVARCRNLENLGFAAGCNVGIAKALSEGCEYILLLNNDCIWLAPEGIAPAVRSAFRDPTIGLIGGKILAYPDQTRIWSVGGHLTILGGERYIGSGRLDRGQYERRCMRQFVSGALMLISRSLLEMLGPLPDVYFFGTEDWEYCLRARRLGFKVVYEPTFVALHEAGNSHDHSDPKYVYNRALSRMLFRRRNQTKWGHVAWRALYGIYLRYFFWPKYLIFRKRYLMATNARVMREVTLKAYADAPYVSRISRGLVEDWRQPMRSDGAAERRREV